MIKYLFNPLKNKQGVALLSVMLVFSVMSIMLGGMTVYSTSHLQRSDANTQTVAAYYAAEAGLNYETERFTAIIYKAEDDKLDSDALERALSEYIAANHNEDIKFIDSNNIKATVAIRKEDQDHNGMKVYRITSTGVVNGQERVVSRDIMFKYDPGVTEPGNGFVVNKSILTQGSLSIDGKVTGNPVGTYSVASEAVFLGWSASVTGVVLPELVNAENSIKINQWDNYSSRINGGLNSVTRHTGIFDFPPIIMPGYPNVDTLPRLPSYIVTTRRGNRTEAFIEVGPSFFNVNYFQSPNQTINQTHSSNLMYSFPSSTSPQTYFVPEINIGNNNHFTVNVANNNITLVTDKINIISSFKVIGTGGSLTIYLRSNLSNKPLTNVTDRLNLKMQNGDGYIGYQGDSSKFRVLIDPLTFASNVSTARKTYEYDGYDTMYASLMAADLNIKMSSGSKIDGYVVTGGQSVEITGGSGNDVALYYAPNAHFIMTRGGKINGAVIAKTFFGDGGFEVNFDEVAFENFPFAVFTPVPGGGSGSVSQPLKLIKGPTFEHNK